MPKYSLLLPTRNGASLLEGCVGSIVSQTSRDFEVVISDNASDDATPEILARYADDPRVVIVRQDEPLGVTDNWNRALAVATGDRIGLIGDDDVLLPGYFERADALVAEHDDPDVLLFNGAAFAFPGFAGSAVSNYADPFYVPAPPMPANGTVDKAARRQIVEHLFRFDFPIPLNMQTALVTRRAMTLLPNGLFQPPFPDFYALAGLMLSDVSWAISPERLAVIGVSPKSFGRTVHNSNSGDSARNYLGIDPDFPDRLPGSEVMNGHYETLQRLKADFAHELEGVEIDRHEYAWQQAYSWYVQRRLGSLSTGDVVARLRMLKGGDWVGLSRLFATRLRPGAVSRRVRLGGEAATSALWPGMRSCPDVHDLAEFAAWIEAQNPRPAIKV
jgi:glycosyltransferase involved in cell wall biosynthesis